MTAATRVLLLHGEEPFLVDEEARAVLKGWRSDLVSDFGFEALDASALTAEQLRGAVQQAPFLDPHRVVVARGVAPRRADALAGALAFVPDSTRLLITVLGKLAAASALVKAVAAVPGGAVREHHHLKGRRLTDWAHSRGRELRLAPNLVAMVAQATHPDLGVIDSELRKLVAYQEGGEQLTPQVVSQLLAGGRQEEVFRLTDELLPRPTGDAWRVLAGMLGAGEGATSLAYRLARHLALVLEVRTRQERGESLPEIQAAIRDHPYVVQKAYHAARSTTAERLEAGLKALLEYEWEVKSGQIDAEWGLEAVLAKL